MNIIYEYSNYYSVSDHGNLIERVGQCENCENDNCEDHYFQSDQIDATRSIKPLNNHEYEYLKSGKHYCSVIDLTEDQ